MLDKIKVYNRKSGEEIQNYRFNFSKNAVIIDDFKDAYQVLTKTDPLGKFTKEMEGWWFCEEYVVIDYEMKDFVNIAIDETLERTNGEYNINRFCCIYKYTNYLEYDDNSGEDILKYGLKCDSYHSKTKYLFDGKRYSSRATEDGFVVWENYGFDNFIAQLQDVTNINIEYDETNDFEILKTAEKNQLAEGEFHCVINKKAMLDINITYQSIGEDKYLKLLELIN